MRRTIESIVESMREHYDRDTIEACVDELPYELIHTLLGEIAKLGEMVVNVRKEVNAMTPPSKYEPYPDLFSDIWDASWYDHPAVRKYEELYGQIEFLS